MISVTQKKRCGSKATRWHKVAKNRQQANHAGDRSVNWWSTQPEIRLNWLATQTSGGGDRIPCMSIWRATQRNSRWFSQVVYILRVTAKMHHSKPKHCGNSCITLPARHLLLSPMQHSIIAKCRSPYSLLLSLFSFSIFVSCRTYVRHHFLLLFFHSYPLLPDIGRRVVFTPPLFRRLGVIHLSPFLEAYAVHVAPMKWLYQWWDYFCKGTTDRSRRVLKNIKVFLWNYRLTMHPWQTFSLEHPDTVKQ